MTKRGGQSGERPQSLDSIRLEDFPENEDLASSYFDWEYDDYRGDNDEEEGTVVMKKADFLAEEDFIEKSLQIIDDDPSEGLEDFTLKLDASYFDEPEDDLAFIKQETVKEDENTNAVVKRLEASAESSRAPSLRRAKGAPRPQVSSRNTPAKASAQAKRRSGSSTDENGSHTSVARLFAQEDTVKLKKAATARIKEETKEEVEELKPARKTASGLSGQGQKKKTSPGRAQISRAPQNRSSSSSAKRSAANTSGGSNKGTSSRSSSSRSSSQSSRSSAQSRPRSSKGNRNSREKKKPIGLRVAKFFIFLLLWIAVAVVCYKGYQFAYDIFYDVAIDPEDISKIEVTLKGDEDDDKVGQLLLDNGLIDDLKIYKYRCKLYKSDYRSGTYKLSRSFNTEKIVNILSGYDYVTGRMEEEETEAASEAEGESVEGEGEWQEGENPQGEGGDEEN